MIKLFQPVNLINLMKKMQLIKFVGFFFITIFFLILVVIAITLGQGRTWNDDGTITQTSIVKLTSVPKDIQVFLDGKEVSLTDSKIEWVEPGLRKIKLVKSGYKDWEKTVKLEAGIVKDIYAQLYPEKLDFSKLTESNIDQLHFSENSEYAYFTILNNAVSTQNGLWRLKLSRNFLDIGNNIPVLISPLTDDIVILRNNDYDILVSSDNNKVILNIPSSNTLKIIDVNRQTSDKDISKILGYYPDKFYWFKGSSSVIIEKNNLLFEYELSNGQKNLIDFSFENKLLYTVNNEYIIYQNTQDKKIYNYSDKSSEVLEPEIINQDVSGLKNIRTIKGSKDIIILVFSNSFVYINLDKDFSEEVKDVSRIINVSSNGGVILFERGEEVFSYTLESTPNNLSFNSSVDRFLVEKDKIIQTYFTPNNKNILFKLKEADTNLVSIVSFDIDGNNRIEVITDPRVSSKNDFAVSGDSSKMYISLKEQLSNELFNTNLYELELLKN